MIKVFTAGTWDLFHIGHLNILKKSKELGDYLVVGVSTDELVYSYKNKIPIISLEDRIQIIMGCRYVDEVVAQDKLLGIPMLNKINPNVFTIGSDWKNKKLEGISYMINHGVQIHYIDYTTGISSRYITEKIRSS